MLENKDIILGDGLGDLRLGMTREAVMILLGKPDEKEEFAIAEDEQSDMVEAWHYDEYEISITFDEESDWLLTAIAVNSDTYSLEGLIKVGESKDDVLKKLQKLDPEVLQTEDMSEDGIKAELVFVEKLNLNLWFEEDILTEIQFGIIEDEDNF